MLIAKKILGTCAYLGGIPAVPETFCWDWGQLIQLNTEYLCRPGELVNYDRATISYHAQARNMLVQRFLGDWLLQLDADHSFEPDLAIRMVAVMEKYKIDVLTGMYWYKSYPHLPLIYLWNDMSGGFIPAGQWPKDKPIFQVDCAGGGCHIVRRSVYNKIISELGESPYHPMDPLSEDFSFFRRCMLLGIKTYCAPDIQCGHLVTRSITEADFVPGALPLVDNATGQPIR